MPARPNIIYVVCHDLGRVLGCYGAQVATPHLDRFAAQGIRFDQAVCNAPACSPSRMCAMTGKWAHRCGAFGLAHMGWPLPAAERTIVDHLNDAGYQTAHFGLGHERHPQQNRYQIDGEDDWSDWAASRAVDRSIDWLRSRQQEDDRRPFYFNIGTQEVHASKWRQDDVVERDYGGPVAAEDVWIPPHLPDVPGLRQRFRNFQAAIRHLDQQFGRLLRAIDELPDAANTMIIFTTDHGIDGHRDKGTLYERGVETALLIRPPAELRGGYAVSHLIQNIDFVPTFLDAAGVPVPGDCDGRSFWPLLSGEAYQPHDAVFTERNFHGEHPEWGVDHFIDRFDPIRSIRTERFHYLRRFDAGCKPRAWRWHEVEEAATASADIPPPTQPRPREELYDVLHDPQETRDLAARPEYRHVLRELRARVQQWMATTGDPVHGGTVPEPYCAPGWGNWSSV